MHRYNNNSFLHGCGALLLALLLSAGAPLMAAGDAAFPIGNLDLKGVDEAAGGDEPLPPEQAFAITAPLYDGKILNLRWDIAEDYYLYREKFKVRVLNNRDFTAGTLELPEGKTKEDEFFGKVQALYHSVDARLPLTPVGQTVGPLQLELSWQGCAEALGICYPPEVKYFATTLPDDATRLAEGLILEEVPVESIQLAAEDTPATTTTAVPPPEGAKVAAPAEKQRNAVAVDEPLPEPVEKSEQDQIADTLASGNILLTLLSFLGFGLLLSLTPCVFPMIPILSGIIAGQKDLTSRSAFIMSLVYVLAMALTYTAAGVLAGLFGSNLQAMFQNPWILGVFSLVFVLLSLSMFGFYELQMPAAIQSRLTEISNRQSGGTLAGVAIMGILSALIVGPCVAAPLAGALIYIGQTGDAVLGGAALFALSIGMGVPLLIIGTSAGKLLPRAGMWMESVKAVFGVLMLAVAIWMLERILPAAISMWLWAALLVLSAVYMGALSLLPEGSSGWRKLWKGISWLLLLHGSLLVVGAAAGGHDALQPLKGIFGGNAATSTVEAGTPEVRFRRVVGLDGLDQALAAAKGKPVMLDFYADWCISCKEMEKYTFPDPDVRTALADFVLLQADVTANLKTDKDLMKYFGLYGPPAMLFFDAEGKERKELRLVGFLPAERFAAHVRKVQGGS